MSCKKFPTFFISKYIYMYICILYLNGKPRRDPIQTAPQPKSEKLCCKSRLILKCIIQFKISIMQEVRGGPVWRENRGNHCRTKHRVMGLRGVQPEEGGLVGGGVGGPHLRAIELTTWQNADITVRSDTCYQHINTWLGEIAAARTAGGGCKAPRWSAIYQALINS